MSALSQLFLLCVILGFAGCAPSRSKSRIPLYDTDATTALEASEYWQVRCRETRGCPNTVAQLLMVSGRSAGVCTATLIGPDLALTNSHCFDFAPQARLERLCQRGAVLIFPSNSPSGREVVECESILKKTDVREEGFRHPDYMILKLKRNLNRGYERLSSQGIADSQRLTIKKINPVRDGFGELVIDRCEVLHGTALLPANKSDFSPVHVTRNCEVISGNSGSALFDGQGNIRGLIFAALIKDKIDKMKDEYPAEFVETIKRVKPAFLTNGACIEFLERRLLPQECSQGLLATEQDVKTENILGSETLLQEIRQSRVDSRYGFALKEREGKGLSYKVSYRPICYNEEWAPGVTARNDWIEIINWEAQVRVDERLQLSLRTGPAQRLNCGFSLSRPQGAGSVLQVTPTSDECSVLPSENWVACSDLTRNHRVQVRRRSSN